jgi:KUP system potassium uptake protein
MRVVHTSKDQRGQVYVPLVNTLLAIVCILLVVTFQSSARLAAMFGLAVSATMFATDVVFFVVATRVLHWKTLFVIPFTLAFGALDATFFLAGLPKFLDGAWVPLVVAGIISMLAITWLTGRRAVAQGLAAGQKPMDAFLAQYGNVQRPTDRTIVLFTGDPSGVPFVDNHRWLGPLIAEERLVLLTIAGVPVPYVDEGRRVTIDAVTPEVVRVRAAFGYMERPTLAPILQACSTERLHIAMDTSSFVYANPIIVPKREHGLPRWQRSLFSWMQRNARTLAEELEIPANVRVELSVDAEV